MKGDRYTVVVTLAEPLPGLDAHRPRVSVVRDMSVFKKAYVRAALLGYGAIFAALGALVAFVLALRAR